MTEPTKTAVVTERVVLKSVKADDTIWEVLGTVRAASKAAAIKQLAKDAPGRYRAPSLRSWKGGLEIVVPDKPKPETRLFDA